MPNFVHDFSRAAQEGMRSLVARYLDEDQNDVPVGFVSDVLAAAVTNAVFALYHPSHGVARDLTLMRREHGLKSEPTDMLLHLVQLTKRVITSPSEANTTTEGHIGAIFLSALAANSATILALLSSSGVRAEEVMLEDLIEAQLDIITSAIPECC